MVCNSDNSVCNYKNVNLSLVSVCNLKSSLVYKEKEKITYISHKQQFVKITYAVAFKITKKWITYSHLYFTVKRPSYFLQRFHANLFVIVDVDETSDMFLLHGTPDSRPICLFLWGCIGDQFILRRSGILLLSEACSCLLYTSRCV